MAPDAPRSTVLIIEDDATQRELMGLHVSNGGYKVLLAEDAVVGGRLLLQERPDLLLIDADLPYISGIEFVSALIADENAPDLPIIFITGRKDLAERAAPLAEVVMLKPYTATKLLAQVERCIANAYRRREQNSTVGS